VIDERDAVIDRVVESLRPLPVVDDAAKARLLIAVAAERERDRESAMRRHTPRRMSRWIIRGTGVVAAAALIGAILLRNTQQTEAPVRTVVSPTPAPAVRLAGSDARTDAESAPQSVELVLRAPSASNVRVVGDFNGWDQDQAPMKRDAASGLWSVTLSLRPGRHIYAFVVDDTLWMRDPRAPAAKDADFGRPGSVMLVGRP
jgi:hypothetical protein